MASNTAVSAISNMDYSMETDQQLVHVIEEVIALHNKYRAAHGVPPLTRNLELEALATKWARTLSHEPKLRICNEHYNGARLGESLAAKMQQQVTFDYLAAATASVNKWYSEKDKFRFGSEPPNAQGIGYFTQMVWKNSTEIGVGLDVHRYYNFNNTSGSKFVLVCFYSPAGNVKGEYTANVLKPNN